MNRNQEFAELLMKLIEVASSTSASSARVLKGGMQVIIAAAPFDKDKPRLTTGQLLMSDIAMLSVTVNELVQHLKSDRKNQQ